MSVSPQSMRDTLRLWASGVAVVSTSNGAEKGGMTVSAFNSLSLEPPQVLVCISKDTVVSALLQESRVFSISVLDATQAHISDRFAGRVTLAEGEDRFDAVACTTAVTGSPVLTDALAWLDCRVFQIYDGGTHWIVVGEVVATGHRDNDLDPLIYYNRSYQQLTAQEERA